MKVRLYSDLHREFDGWEIPPLKDRKKEKNYVLVLAGDIGVARKNGTYVPFLTDMAERHKAVVYVPGNHEYYGDSFDRAWQKITGELQGWEGVDNLHFLNGDAVTIDGVRIIGATLWTDFNLYGTPDLSMNSAGTFMNDYHVITRLAETDEDDGWQFRGKLRPEHTQAQHFKHRDFIDRELKQANEEGLKTLVVTHHGPARQSIAEHFAGSGLNPAYVSDLSDLIRERAPTAWVHGHTHHTANYVEGSTRVMTNPKGYPERNWRKDGEPAYENPNFREDGILPELNELLTVQ